MLRSTSLLIIGALIGFAESKQERTALNRAMPWRHVTRAARTGLRAAPARRDQTAVPFAAWSRRSAHRRASFVAEPTMRDTILPGVFLTLLVASASVQGQNCGLAPAAFCETFESGPAPPSDRGRGHELSRTRFSTNRYAPS